MDILSQMTDSLLRYAKITSQIIGVPITIINRDLFRINYEGGRDKWRSHSMVGHSMVGRGGIADAAVTSGESQVMLEPRTHPACKTCPNFDACFDQAEIWVPIKYYQNVIGAVAINCETKRQVQRMQREWKDYLRFLEQIAELIAFDAKQRIESQRDQSVIELLTTVMEQVDSGVIVLDDQNHILRSNHIGRQMLVGQLPYLLENPLRVTDTGEETAGRKRYRLQSGDDACTVTGSLHHVHSDSYSRFLIFTPVSPAQEKQQVSAFQQITGTSSAIQAGRDQGQTAARSRSSVLIQAEHGLGRELYAKAIHDESDAAPGPFLSLNCASLPENEIEKILFGTVGTAGAKGRAGQIELANGGTLFLDNISALPYAVEQRLVTLLERKEITRVGSRKARRVNVRLIAGTTTDLKEACAEERFDLNFYYLISVLTIVIPPLRMRSDDVRLLAMHSIQKYSQELGKRIASIDADFWTRMERYDWPGNVRELQSCMERVVNMTEDGALHASLLPETMQPAVPAFQPGRLNLEAVERETIGRALVLQKQKGLSMEELAKILGIGPATLYRKIKKYQL